MIETILMYFICALVWFFVLAPALAGYISNSSTNTYLELVAFGAVLTFIVFVVFLFCLSMGLILMFLDGDPTPISTMLSKAQ